MLAAQVAILHAAQPPEGMWSLWPFPPLNLHATINYRATHAHSAALGHTETILRIQSARKD